ncbi:MAG: ATP-dependent sacrificial sulfur transferase LarE [Deltaproteobacteria bacterium]|nr:ATP-dependent sacrificial sulfur transferase LarE [Deltaproteobacteria bacterium]
MDVGQASFQKKLERLMRVLKTSGPLLVAFSGGVDSAFLLAAAAQALGREKVIAATAEGPLFPKRELDRASAFCRERAIDQRMLPFDPLGLDAFRDNPPDRCYLCKQAMAALLADAAAESGVKRVVHGANLDDLDDHRPGLRAAREAGIESPLIAARLGKAGIRRLSREMGLPTWDLPSQACLASRIPYGERITTSALERIDRAERFFEEAGFSQIRVRHHQGLARVEVPPGEIARALEPETRKAIVDRLRGLGFLHVALDLEGYVPGSLNRKIIGNEV